MHQCAGSDAPDVPSASAAPPADLIQISYSDLGAYHQCARRYTFEKRLRMGTLPDLKTTAVKRGTLMHTLLEGARDGRLDGRQAAALFAREQLTDLRDQEALLQAIRRVLDSRDYAEILAGCDIRCERQFYLALHDPARPVPGPAGPGPANAPAPSPAPARFLKGYIDIQSTRAQDGSLLILDYKSGTRAQACAADYEDQARCYALVGLADGHPSVEVRFIRPEVTGTDGAPQVFALGPYTRADYASIEAALIAAIHDMEQAGPDAPIAADAFACRDCPVPHSACPRA
ncbi:MAG: PD-(D/E)XK nuclease family protein [Coriobacteriia bacterium]|nr:PD-(D/E)XK nuclease family protein [Coriobacteriia bacterium]